MVHDRRTPDALRSLAWRLLALIGSVATLAAIVSSDGIRYGMSAALRVPVTGVDARDLVDSFAEPREGGRRHEAIDIPALRGTPVVAAGAGRVRRIFSSPRGGLGLYQIDGAGTRCFYYAHLHRYASGLEEGHYLNAGDVIGYVGTTGNAPEGVPHLHFAVMSLQGTTRCSEGRAINPMSLFR